MTAIFAVVSHSNTVSERIFFSVSGENETVLPELNSGAVPGFG